MSHPGSTPSTLVSHLGRYRDGDWDAQVLARTKLCLLDSLACFSAGLGLHHFQQSLIGFQKSFAHISSAAGAAYVYGQASNALDYDDTLIGHPGAPIVGAVLAIAAEENLPADRILGGIAGGYEAHAFLCSAALPSPQHAANVRSVGVWDTVAAAIGILIARNADAEAIERVIGVAAAHTILPYTAKWYDRPVPAMKNNMGWIAMGAVLSANLAEAGQTGVTNVLDGENGMWRMAGSDRWQPDPQPLAMKPAVLRVGFKRFPGCWHTQQYLKALSDLLETVEPEDRIEEIIVYGPEDVEKFCSPVIAGTADIAFSLPALFSKLIDHVEPGPRWETEIADNSETFAFRFEHAEQPGLSIRTVRGKVQNAVVAVSKGLDLASGGLDGDGVVAKFMQLTADDLRNAGQFFLGGDRQIAGNHVPGDLYDTLRSTVSGLLSSQ